MALSEGVAIDAQDDESAGQETVREFEITDVGELGVGHEQEGDYRGNPGGGHSPLRPQPRPQLSSLHRSGKTRQSS
jgi:hypothetical protein